MGHRNFFSISLLLLLAGSLVACKQLPWENYAQTGPDMNPQRMDSPEAAAKSAFEALPQLLTPDQLKNAGFSSADELRQAELGKPMPFVAIPLDQMNRQDPGFEKPLPLDWGTAGQIFPVSLNGDNRLMIRVEPSGEQFQVAALGERDHLELVREATISAKRQFGDSLPDPANFRIIHLPGMNTSFSAVEVNGNWWLLADRNAPVREMDIQRGQWYPVEQISPYIKRYAAKLLDQVRDQQTLR